MRSGRRFNDIAMILMAVVLMAVVGMSSGCTTTATTLAIQNYETNANLQQTAFNDACRVAEEQLFLSTSLFMRATPEEAPKALQAYAQAQNGLMAIRLQYERARTIDRLTVGQYLYNQQGWGSVLLGNLAHRVKLDAGAANQATATTGTDPQQLLQNPGKGKP